MDAEKYCREWGGQLMILNDLMDLKKMRNWRGSQAESITLWYGNITESEIGLVPVRAKGSPNCLEYLTRE